MHKLAAAGEALVPVGPFFRHERAAGRPLPPVLADRRRGDRLRRPGRRRRARSCCCTRCSTELRRPRRPAAPVEPRHARRRAPPTAPSSQAHLRAQRGPPLATRSASASTSTRCARSTPTTPARARSWRRAPLLLDHLDADDAAHFAEVRALLDAAGIAYEVDPTLVRGLDYYTRTVFEFTSGALGAQSARRRRRPLRRPRRAARRPADARASAGRPGSSACCSPPSTAREPQPRRRPLRRVGEARRRPRRGVRARRRGAPRGPRAPSWSSPAARSRASSSRPTGSAPRYVAILGDEGIALKDMESGEQETVESARQRWSRACCEGRHPG